MNDQNTNTTSDCCGDTCELGEPGRKAQPAYQVTEHEAGVSIDVALPGVRKEDLQLSITGPMLTLSGRRSDRIPEDWKVHHAAGQPDLYELKVRLNRTLEPGKVTATLTNGILRLDIAKRDEAQPRKISVN